MRTAISGLALIMSPKVSPLMTIRSPGSTTSAVADRGARSRITISPKKSPFSSTARVVSPSLTFFLMATLPDWMMYMSSPSSPSRKRTWPFSKCVRNFAKGLPAMARESTRSASAGVLELIGQGAPLPGQSLDGQEQQEDGGGGAPDASRAGARAASVCPLARHTSGVTSSVSWPCRKRSGTRARPRSSRPYVISQAATRRVRTGHRASSRPTAARAGRGAPRPARSAPGRRRRRSRACDRRRPSRTTGWDNATEPPPRRRTIRDVTSATMGRKSR